MIDLMTRLMVHHMAKGGLTQATIAEKSEIGLRSVERILTEESPTAEELAVNQLEGASRRGRPPKADEAVVEAVRRLLEEDPKMLATEVLRRSRAWGYDGGKSAMSVLVKHLRPSPKKELVVGFDGLPGEYAQFDFGKCWVKFADGSRHRVIFFAGRLKYSRYMHVELVANEQSETVVRSLIACLMTFGGSPKEWVFDNPRTIRLTPWGVEPVMLHPYLRDLVAEYRVIPTFCAPRSGNQKGTVERLVGYTKKSFLLARTFHDRADLEQQLAEWLYDANHVRPCDATGVIPEVARQEEARWLNERPVRVAAADHPLRETKTVTPMGTVSWGGTPYFATESRIGAPATLLIRRETIEIIVGDGVQSCLHSRQDGVRVVQRLPYQRDDALGSVHGRRKQATFRRQCLIEVGPEARAFLGILVHVCPDGRWERPCTELYDLLQVHGVLPGSVRRAPQGRSACAGGDRRQAGRRGR
ncbi:MAG: IS21 family transposase [Myxococcota bacterium]|nr:IS21 family transposase [Myxococcota bacterium]